jgi:hypothetical protein
MKRVLFALLATATAICATSAHATTDTIDSGNNGSGYYFLPPSAYWGDSPYYRNSSQDWDWTHNAIAGTITSATLSIGAYDVDSGSFPSDEHDWIQAYDAATSSWLDVGELTGIDSAYNYSTFNLASSLWDDVSTGLKVRVDIDRNNAGWLLTLTKSVIITNNEGTLPPVNGAVPEPASWAMMLAGFGLAGAAMRRARKTSVTFA